MNSISNVLASRYASKDITDIWSESGRILLEREFWIAIMKTQKELGISIPSEAIQAYEQVKENINLDSIHNREKTLRHDVKSRIEEFCNLAGYEYIHMGLTSRDLTDNIEQYQVLKSLKIIRLKALNALDLLAKKANEYKSILISGRTHNVAAQPITFGKRLAMFGEELIIAINKLEYLINTYPLRGIKGAAGTLLDIKTLLNNDTKKVNILQNKIKDYLGFKNLLDSVGQVYPRSLDFEVISTLYQLSSAPSSFCKTLRIMAGHELASEGFKKGQVGSSAMPHKMNSRNSERVNGFNVILRGYLSMAEGLAGDQWNEGDVSCSVVRRVCLPDAFFAIDGLFQTLSTILNEMGISDKMIEKETNKYLPFLITTTFLMNAVKKGMGREKAHEIIKHNALNVIKDLRSNTINENDLIERLASNKEFSLSLDDLKSILKNADDYIGESSTQVDKFCKKVNELTSNYPEIKDIKSEVI